MLFIDNNSFLDFLDNLEKKCPLSQRY